jgi:hypothetical protein
MAAQHHYVSRFLLDGFTDTGTRDGRLFVFDQRQPKTWWTSTSKAARERDFCRIDIPGAGTDAVDHGLGGFEAEVAPVVREVRSTFRLSRGRQFKLLLNLIALHTAREPATRRIMSGAVDQLLRRELQAATATRERWESSVAAMRRDGFEMPATCTWEGMRDFARSEFTIDMSNNNHVDTMKDAIDIALTHLLARDWSIVVSAFGAPNFITSDRPATLRPRAGLPPGVPLGFGLPNVDVLFPVSKRALLVGTAMPRDFPEVADRGEVAMLNDAIAAFSDRFLFAGEQAFVLRHPSGRVETGIDLLRSLVESKAKLASKAHESTG